MVEWLDSARRALRASQDDPALAARAEAIAAEHGRAHRVLSRDVYAARRDLLSDAECERAAQRHRDAAGAAEYARLGIV